MTQQNNVEILLLRCIATWRLVDEHHKDCEYANPCEQLHYFRTNYWDASQIDKGKIENEKCKS